VRLTPPRLDEPELLDEHDAPHDDVERSLRDLRRFNRWAGGIGAYRRLLRRFGDVKSVVDLGAGTADLLDSIPGDVMRVGVDFKISHLMYLRNGSRAYRVVADAMHLPFRNDAVDVVTSSHFFHHFDDDENARIVGESLRIARAGAAFTDTRRHYAPLLFVHALALLRLVGRITRSDAPGSIRRGYTLAEVRTFAKRFGGTAFRLFPYRFGIILRK
jgi:hypothetical protein